jgi:shikimate dehydrogenase
LDLAPPNGQPAITLVFSPLDPALLQSDHLVYDTIYSTPTRLLREAAAAGARTANGLSMLLHQGALAFEIWFQRPAPLELMREALHCAVSPSKP